MSENSSNSHHHHLRKIRHKSDAVHHVLKNSANKTTAKKRRQWVMLLLLPLWVAVSFVTAQFITGLLLVALRYFGVPLTAIVSSAVFETLVASFIYIMTLCITIGVPYWVKKRQTDLTVLGLDGLPTWIDILLSPLAFIVYALFASFVSYMVLYLIPSFPIDQAQEVGFRMLSRQYEYTLAFLTLVVIAPIAEEVLFRGYLYGKLQKYVPVVVSVLATSVLFALAHLFASNQLQWNIALDTFCFSIVLCILRSITGGIWASILLHMIKNGIAFFILFGGALFMLG